MTEPKSYVTYEEFGAKGDGVTDDMPAIAACHAFANTHGLDVRAKDGGRYYIGGKDLTAEIKTNTYWGKAEFIIDDRNVENIRQNCFKAVPDGQRIPLEMKTLRRDQKKLEFSHEGNMYVRVLSETKKVYIRKGLNQDGGFDASDCFLVDRQGNIQNPISWDYDDITSAWAVSTDDRPLVIDGGIFTTVANQRPSKYTYHERNIRIERSHVTLQNITHYITGEGEQGAPYDGFISIKRASHVTVRNCLLTAHKIYWTESQIPGKLVQMGSYDLLCNESVDVLFSNIRQTTDILDTAYWGLMCSNFCKELHLQGCRFSRFDAHCGVTNGSIRDCTLGHQGIRLTGFGHFLIENTHLACRRFLWFRSDYGAFFHGKLTIRNCTWTPVPQNENTLYVLSYANNGEHNFGYPCSMPEDLMIDGLTILDEEICETVSEYVLLFHYDKSFAPGKPYPYGTPKRVYAKISSHAGKPIRLCENPAQYPHIQNYELL